MSKYGALAAASLTVGLFWLTNMNLFSSSSSSYFGGSTGWPKDHNFQFFKLEIENIFLINWFGGPKPLTVEQYLQAEM